MAKKAPRATLVAAEWLGISEERVRQLVKSGYIPAPTAELAWLKGAVQGYIKFLKDETRHSTKSAAASRSHDARAKHTELRTARETGELIPTDEAAAAMQTIIGTFIAGLDSIPAQLTRDMDERGRIESAIDAVREKVADMLEEFGASYAGLGEHHPAEPEDNAGHVGAEESAIPAKRRQAGAARSKPDALRNSDSARDLERTL